MKAWLNILKYTKFEFGEQAVSQFIVFECKYLFSIIFFYFHRSEGSQDRFHTHAFNAISIRLFGTYEEEILDNNKVVSVKARENKRILYIPRNHYHRITKSKGCLTLLLAGPWKKTWKEYKDKIETEYNWTRKLKLK